MDLTGRAPLLPGGIIAPGVIDEGKDGAAKPFPPFSQRSALRLAFRNCLAEIAGKRAAWYHAF